MELQKAIDILTEELKGSRANMDIWSDNKAKIDAIEYCDALETILEFVKKSIK